MTWGEALKTYIYHNLVALDHLINTLTGGEHDESLSTRIGKSIYLKGSPPRLTTPFVALIELVWPGHFHIAFADHRAKLCIKCGRHPRDGQPPKPSWP